MRLYTLKAKPTKYRFCSFRSRLEARWAVFFDVLGIEWLYELEGFELPNGISYLPDFWLPQVHLWAEVKPGAFTEDEIFRCISLAMGTHCDCLLLEGMPDFREYIQVMQGVPGELYLMLPHTIGTNYLYEHRFFCQGEPEPGDIKYFNDSSSETGIDLYSKAVTAARSARFEFGKSG